MPKKDDGLRYWRTMAEVVGIGMPGQVKIKIHGWDLTLGPVNVDITELPSAVGIVKKGLLMFVQVAEDPPGHLHLKNWEAAPPPIDESVLIHTP